MIVDLGLADHFAALDHLVREGFDPNTIRISIANLGGDEKEFGSFADNRPPAYG